MSQPLRWQCFSFSRGPAVSETGGVFDMVETRGRHHGNFFADTLDKRALHWRDNPSAPLPGDEILAVDEIVDLAVADLAFPALSANRGHDP